MKQFNDFNKFDMLDKLINVMHTFNINTIKQNHYELNNLNGLIKLTNVN